MKVPFMDLRAQHDEVRGEIDAVLKDIVDNSSFIGGPRVDDFEKDFAEFCGTEFAVGCASGTDALKLAIMGAGVGAGEVVITVSHTFIATVEAITQVGAIPAFVDIEKTTYNMNPERIREFLLNRCRLGQDGRPVDSGTGCVVSAVLPVHLYGLPVDMKPILELADEHGLAVIEDAAQAHGATYDLNGRYQKVGSFGKTAGFSFYPGKNLGAMGEAGAAVTNDARANRNMRIWRDHGQNQKYSHVSLDGWNGRLDTLQAAVLTIKLEKLNSWNEKRRQAAGWYCERLAGEERIVLPIDPEGRKHVYHLFVVRLPEREKVQQRLSEKGIGTGFHYPIPLHLQPAYADLGMRKGDLPETESAAESIISLPMFPHITEEQVAYVCEELKKCV